MIWKLFTFAVMGYLSSYLAYPKTHSMHEGSSTLPELFGITIGCIVVLLAFVAMSPKDDKATMRLVAAFSSVGLGVAANRIRMMMEGTNGC